jgi:dTMP kinase
MLNRGLLIALEGCDRSGKTTHCKRLVEELQGKSVSFPDRTTYVGKLIDTYLRGETVLDDHAIHLLFSSNRWERAAELRSAISQGFHVVVDRYSYSGIAYSAAKGGLSFDWCKEVDRGLPKPDLVCFLDVSPAVATCREGFGAELYEDVGFQEKVRNIYLRLMGEDEGLWKRVDTNDKTIEEVFQEILAIVRVVIENHDDMPLGYL